MKAKLSRKDKALYDEIRKEAEKFISARIKLTGKVEYIPDGKTNLLVSFKWVDLLKMMAEFFISEVTRLRELGKKQ